MVQYKSLRENSTSILERDKALGSYGNMKRCILEAKFEGQRWSSRLFTILLILTWELRYPQKKGLTEKVGGVLEGVLPGRGQMTYLGEGRICWGTRDRGELYRLIIK